MKFNSLQALSCGNAIRIIVEPTAGESRWRILRKETNDFAGADDPGAFRVHDGADRFLTDARLLANGVTYFYAVFGRIGDVWAEPVVLSAVPAATFDDLSVDVQELVRERLDLTLNAMIARGKLALTKTSLPVMSIPFYTQGAEFPVVTVLFGGSSPSVHALGDVMGSDVLIEDGVAEMQGWLSAVTLEVSAWSLNAEERNVLRQGLASAVAANLHVFDDLGLQMFEVQSVQDTEDTQSMNVPVYQTMMRLGCTAATVATDESGLVGDVVFSRPGTSGGTSGGATVGSIVLDNDCLCC